MKYIRTEDGIFDNGLMDGVMPEYISAQSFGIEVIKYADTIEDLCDAFVMAHLKNKRYYYARYESINELQDIARTNKELTIYGAIWTDKGLIYVAKYNNGEFTLL